MQRIISRIWLLVLATSLASCLGGGGPKQSVPQETRPEQNAACPPAESTTLADVPPDSPAEARMRAMGLVEITEIDPLVRVKLVYATPDNFMGVVLYKDLRKAFLLPAAAEKLTDARRRLQIKRPELTLLVYDAARPFSVQERMWEEAVRLDKTYYVSDPSKGGGLHNYGAAVDLTLCDAAGVPLPMGAAFDYFGPEANTDRENDLLQFGKITKEELENRLLLRRVMTDAGFTTIASEWWHFNLVSREKAVATLQKIE